MTVTTAPPDWLTVTDRAPTNTPPRINTGDSQTSARRVTERLARLACCGSHNVPLPCVNCLGEGRDVAVPRTCINICTRTHIAHARGGTGRPSSTSLETPSLSNATPRSLDVLVRLASGRRRRKRQCRICTNTTLPCLPRHRHARLGDARLTGGIRRDS